MYVYPQVLQLPNYMLLNIDTNVTSYFVTWRPIAAFFSRNIRKHDLWNVVLNNQALSQIQFPY